MSFNIGDKVFVLDEDLSGIVKKISKDFISIKTEDGFLLAFKASELVICAKDEKSMKTALFSHRELQAVVNEKETIARKVIKKKTKEHHEPTMEIDLHINQLVKSTKGMANHDILILQIETARRQLDFAINKRIQKIVFIHGVGEGVLKMELEYLFGRYKNIKHYDANYQKYGLGATEVYIYQNISVD